MSYKQYQAMKLLKEMLEIKPIIKKQSAFFFIVFHVRTKPFKILAHKFFREPQKYFLRVDPLNILARSTEHKPKINVIATPQPIISRPKFKLQKQKKNSKSNYLKNQATILCMTIFHYVELDEWYRSLTL